MLGGGGGWAMLGITRVCVLHIPNSQTSGISGSFGVSSTEQDFQEGRTDKVEEEASGNHLSVQAYFSCQVSALSLVQHNI